MSEAAVAGSVDLRFEDGTAFAHAVDAATCPVSVDLCALFQPCWDPACVDPTL